MAAGIFTTVVIAGLAWALIFGKIIAVPTDDEPSPGRSESELGNYTMTGIAIDGRPCAKVGMDVIREGGGAIDGAIAALLCNGVFNAHSMGIGGGFFMTYYSRETGTAEALIAREQAPSYAHQDMFEDDPDAAAKGPFSMAIPGEIRGYVAAKERYGNSAITWDRLVAPTVTMCREGVEVAFSLASALRSSKTQIVNDPGLSEVFLNPATGDVWQEGDHYTCPKLADTLERLAQNPDDFYTGETARMMTEDLRTVGGNLTLNDMASYTPFWVDPVSAAIGSSGYTVHSVPPPSSGGLLIYMLNVLGHYNLSVDSADEPVTYHRIVEALKWAYAERTHMGDPRDPEITDYINSLVTNLTSDAYAEDTFNKIKDAFTVNDYDYYGADFYAPEDHGTTHMSIIAPNGDAVAITSTINTYFGAGIMSPQTGIIWNDEMDDFSYPNITNSFDIPPSPNNFPKPGKMPLSSMVPTVVVDGSGDVRLVIGASGGTKITSNVGLVTVRDLFFGMHVKEAIDDKRLHHQLAPMIAYAEEGFRQDVVDFLTSRRHDVEMTSSTAICQGVERRDGRILANYDFRKAGGVDGY